VSSPPYDSLNLGLHVGDRAERVIENRARAAAAFGVDLTSLVFARQVHGTAATLVGPDDAGRGTRSEDDAVGATDVLVTTSVAVTPVILVADCVPIALVDPVAGVLALVHAGWRGTSGGAVRTALVAMAEHGGHAADTAAFLGPGVARARYQVGPEVVSGLTQAAAPAPLDPGVARPDGPGHWRVDLVAANRQQLRAAGVPADAIFDSGTSTAAPEFFSDRAVRPCGRFGLLARLVA